MTTATPTINDYLAVQVSWLIELAQEQPALPFQATLIRQETRWYDTDPDPDVVEYTEDYLEAEADLADVIHAVNQWLLTDHHLRVIPHSWRSRPSEGTTGLTLMLEGRAATAVRCTRSNPAPTHDRPAC
ncbi:hypothetical protein [Mycolicibacterium mageritense]|uniref:hypothetical protein n=1 Tax=Mycolicibacterium mageritense TaxID=53462 RepID=UPI0011D549D7|nr:hypothetical protein [Mycolicibacterium mageritense]TXI62918.1 MAG: hypothetical protein E6Q55_11195 [Mycolicibacterium mageritense]